MNPHVKHFFDHIIGAREKEIFGEVQAELLALDRFIDRAKDAVRVVQESTPFTPLRLHDILCPDAGDVLFVFVLGEAQHILKRIPLAEASADTYEDSSGFKCVRTRKKACVRRLPSPTMCGLPIPPRRPQNGLYLLAPGDFRHVGDSDGKSCNVCVEIPHYCLLKRYRQAYRDCESYRTQCREILSKNL